MPGEPRRGCGYRQVGKLYLMGSGIARECDGLPLFLETCHCCGFEPKFYRGFSWMEKAYVAQLVTAQHGDACKCPPDCPICYPENNDQPSYGLMWVGKKFYTPKTFSLESDEMGVSKSIGDIPKDLIIGKTWVVLIHPEVEDYKAPEYLETLAQFDKAFKGKIKPKPPTRPGIFYAFVVTKVEMPIWEHQATPEYLAQLRDKGITPVVLEPTPENIKAHGGKPKKPKNEDKSNNGQRVLERYE